MFPVSFMQMSCEFAWKTVSSTFSNTLSHPTKWRINEQNAKKKWSSRQKKSTQYKYIQIKTHYLTSVTVAVECVLSVYFVNKSCYGHRQAHTHYNLFALSKLAQHKTKIIFNADFFLHLLHSVIFWFCIQLFFFRFSTSILHLTCLLLKYWSPEWISHTLLYCTVDIFFYTSEAARCTPNSIWEINQWKIEDCLMFTYHQTVFAIHMNKQTNKQTNEQSQKNTVDV